MSIDIPRTSSTRTETAPQQVTLPDSLMRAITLMTGDRQAPPATILEAAVLITFGYALYRRQDSIDPAQVAVPISQWNIICQALLGVPSWSGLTGVNLGLDWVNLGPAAQDEPAADPDAAPLVQSAQVPDYPVTAWQRAVAEGSTRLGYTAWTTGMRQLRQASDTIGKANASG